LNFSGAARVTVSRIRRLSHEEASYRSVDVGRRRSAGDAADRDDRRYDNDRRGNDRNWRGDDRNWDPSNSYRDGKYRERRLSRNDRIYRGRDGRAYCKRNDGTTGLVIGALGGGALANLIGGGTLGTLAGAGGGALLGRSVDRGNVKCR
jgi:hypothetical protein